MIFQHFFDKNIELFSFLYYNCGVAGLAQLVEQRPRNA